MSKTEYIEREKLIRHLEDEIAGCKVPAGSRANGKSIAYGTALGLKMAKSFAETLPTADVAPKSEVDRLHEIINGFEEQSAKELQDFLRLSEKYEKAKQEVAREIFAKIDREIVDALKSNYEARQIRIEKWKNPTAYIGGDFVSICDGKIAALRGIEGFIAELREKYTGVKSDE